MSLGEIDVKYTLQIIHKLVAGGENVIEVDYDQRYQAEAEERRHKQRIEHRTATCETFIIVDPTK